MSHPNLEYIRRYVDHSNPKDLYRLVLEIGSGTYGDVYKAVQIQTNNYVAIKIMKIDLKDDVTAICQEIHTLKECKHVNIVQYYGSYLQQTKLWICMEYCGGQSMQDIYLNLRRPIGENTIAFISRETLRGLAYMHTLNRIHRDIKGANILLTDYGDVKIADFGIAAKLTDTVAKRSTLIGTPYWMAPEVAAVNNTKSSGYDERCDIWAVGITAIEYAELQPPLFDFHPMKALQILGQRSYNPPRLQRKDLWSPKFHSFLKSALTKNERKRPVANELLHNEFVSQNNLTEELTQELIRDNRKERKLPVFMSKPSDNKKPSNPPQSNQPQHRKSPQQPAGASAGPIITPNNLGGAANNGVLPVAQSGGQPIVKQRACGNGVSDAIAGVRITDSANLRPLDEAIYASPILNQSEDNDDLLLSLDKELQKLGHRSLLKEDGARNSFYDNVPTAQGDNAKYGKNAAGSQIQMRPQSNMSAQTRPVSTPIVSSIDNSQQQPSSPSNTGTQKPSRPDKPPQYLSELSGVIPATSSSMVEDMQQFNIPKHIPKVHMGACFVLMFEGCSLKINSSSSWTHPDTKEKLILLGTNDGIYYLNTNEMHDTTLVLLVPRRCLWLSVLRDTMMSLSGKGPHLYMHNLVSLLRLKSQDQTMGRINKFLPKRFRPSTKLQDTKTCQMASIIRNPFTGGKYMCAAVGKQIFLYEWFSPRSCFIEIKRVDVPTMPCPLLNFDLLVSREQNFPIVCLGVFKTPDEDKYKLNLINTEENNRSVWFQSPNEAQDRLEVVKVLQIEPNTLLICLPDRALFMNMAGKAKTSRNKINYLDFGSGTYINSVVGLKDSILVFHANGLKGVDFSGEITQDINDDKHIYRLLSSDTYTSSILVESKPVDTPMDNGNIYMLVGHQDL